MLGPLLARQPTAAIAVRPTLQSYLRSTRRSLPECNPYVEPLLLLAGAQSYL